jgi:PAS domain S-box-containing protein
MVELLARWILDPSGLTPHGFCLLWDPWLIWTHAASDIAIALAYFSIPVALASFASRRRDLVFRPVFWLFAAFILLCGAGHWLSLLTIWVPAYGLEAVVKASTGLVSLMTAVALWVLLPKALEIPSQERLREANDALRESEARAISSYTKTPLPLYLLNANGIVTAVSDRWLDLLGYQREEVIGLPLTRFHEPLPAESAMADWRQIYAVGEVLDAPSRFVRSDGAVLDVLTSMRVECGGGDSVRMLGAIVDVTARLRAEEALRKSEERARLALSAVNSVGNWDWDIVKDQMHVDEPVARIFGIDPDRASSGVPLYDYLVRVPPEDRARMVREYQHAMVKGGDCTIVHPVIQPEGIVQWFMARGVCSVAENGTPLRIRGVLIDITAQHTLEEQLRQSQKMEAVGQLTGGLAHDFNNLLQGISGSLEMLKDLLADHDPQAIDRAIAVAQASAARAAAVTQRLLAFSRQQVLSPEPCNTDALIAGMEELIRRTAGPEITVQTAPTIGIWPTLCDANQMENALLNLCINAKDAMPDGGRLIIETANSTIDDRCAREWDMVPGDYVAVCVSDTGVGMPPDALARAFEPFYTTKPIGAGTGLGLSMIYGFAKQSGGQARIHSEVGRGTKVWIYLPRYLGEPARKRVPAQADVPRAKGSGRVLVVDDEESLREQVATSLARRGYKAYEAVDGASALRMLQSLGQVDLLITDVGLRGGMNGRQLADAARKRSPDLKVLFITGYAANAVVSNGLLEHGMEVLTKPFSLKVLVAKVQAMVCSDEGGPEPSKGSVESAQQRYGA